MYRELWLVLVSLAIIGVGGAIAVVPVYANLLTVAESVQHTNVKIIFDTSVLTVLICYI